MQYRVTTEWYGYSRGTAVYIVEADNEKEAEDRCYEGEEIERTIVRNDTESYVLKAEREF